MKHHWLIPLAILSSYDLSTTVFANKNQTSTHVIAIGWDEKIDIDPLLSIWRWGTLILFGSILHIIVKSVIGHIKPESTNEAKASEPFSKGPALMSNYNFQFHHKIMKLFAYLFFLTAASAACDGKHCCFDNDCSNGYCPGGGGYSCKCEKAWWSNRYGTSQCHALQQTGSSCGTDSNCQTNNCMNTFGSACDSTCGPSLLDGPCDEDSDCLPAPVFSWSNAGYNGRYCGKYDAYTRHATKNAMTCRNFCLADPACNAFAVGRDCVRYSGCVPTKVWNTQTWGFTYEFRYTTSQKKTFCVGGQTSISCGTCREKLDDGGACTSHDDCLSGKCKNHGVSSKCDSTCGLSLLGGKCDEDSDCEGNNFCHGGQLSISCGTCREKLDDGGACTRDDDCLSRYCKGLTCTKKLENGEACTRYDDCSSGLCKGRTCTKKKS